MGLRMRNRKRLGRRRGREDAVGPEFIRLSELPVGEQAEIVKVAARGEIRKRLIEMGVVRGTRVEMKRVAPLGDPVEIKLLGYHLSLRQSEAEAIEVQRI